MATKKVTLKVASDNVPENEPLELHAEDWELDYDDMPEPRKAADYDADALNEEFDSTYEGKQVKDKPFFKKVSFWIIALLAIAAFTALYLYNERQNQLENVPATTAATTAAEVTTAEEITIEVKDFVMPAGSSVVKGSKGWGLYDYYGNLNSNYLGIASNDNGTWFINHGLCDFGFTGRLKVGDTIYRVEKGKVDITAPIAGPSSEDSTTATAANSAGSSKQQEAAKEASDYLLSVSSSRSWLIAQLQSDGYTYDDAVWGADHCGADWNEQAYKKAQEYLGLTTFTHDDLITQLVFEGFTQEQAAYGVQKAGL